MKTKTKNQQIKDLEEIIKHLWSWREYQDLRRDRLKPELKAVADAVIASIPKREMILQEELCRHMMTWKDWYKKIYLYSEHWEELKEKAFKHHGKKCHDCGSGMYLQVHHLRYKKVFDVTVEDLQIVCKTCHSKKHGY